jgi:hypothetical protein
VTADGFGSCGQTLRTRASMTGFGLERGRGHGEVNELKLLQCRSV